MSAKKILTTAALGLGVWMMIRWLLPLTAPFWAGLALAWMSEPAVELLRRRTHIPRGAAVGIGVSMTFLIVALTAFTLCAIAFRELGRALPELESAAREGADTLHTLLISLADRTPRAMRQFARENVEELFGSSNALAQRGLGFGLSLAGGMLKGVPDGALGFGTAILSGYMISFRLPSIRRWLLEREFLRPLRTGWSRVKTAVGGWLQAQCKLMGVTFIVVSLGLVLLRIPYAFLWGLGVALVDALPVLGSGTLLIPWCLLTFLRGDTPRAVGLLGIYVTAALLRSVLEPKLLGQHLGLDPLVTLICLYAGFKLLGLPGMLLAPMLAVAATQAAGGQGLSKKQE